MDGKKSQGELRYRPVSSREGDDTLSDSSKRLNFHLLGAADVVLEPPGKRQFRAGKPLALLAYLAHVPANLAPPEHLVDLLWSDLEPESADHASSVSASGPRRSFGNATASN